MVYKLHDRICQIFGIIPKTSCHRACVAMIKTFLNYGDEIVLSREQYREFQDSFFFVGHAYGDKDYCNDLIAALDSRFVKHQRINCADQQCVKESLVPFQTAFSIVRMSKSNSTHFICAIRDKGITTFYDPWYGAQLSFLSDDELLNADLEDMIINPDIASLEEKEYYVSTFLKGFKVDRLDLILPTDLFTNYRKRLEGRLQELRIQ